MTDSIKYIRFYSAMTFLSLLLTYLFSYIAVFDFCCISNDFLIVLFSGIFCSFCVLLVTEIMRYRLCKRNTEDFLYSTLLMLYRNISYEIEYSNTHISNPNFPVPDTFYSSNAPATIHLCKELRTTDYSLFRRTVFLSQFEDFMKNEVIEIENHVSASTGYLGMAFNMERNQPYCQNLISNISPKLTVVKKMKSDAEIRQKALSNLLGVLSSTYPERYSWEKDKESIDSFNFDLNEWYSKNAAFFNE